MFEQSFYFWRRLVGRGTESEAAGGTATAAEEERRLWVRYDADFRTTVQVGADAAPQQVVAQLRDISIGGARLMVPRAFQPGQILTLELPAGDSDEAPVVLACVVRVSRDKDGLWSVGCVFSRELTETDLARFGTLRMKAAPSDKRRWVRFACDCKATFQRVADPTNRLYDAEVLNVSASGIGMQLNEPVEAGALLSVNLIGKDGQPVHTILACVVHATRRSGGVISLGCNFIRELSEDELQLLK